MIRSPAKRIDTEHLPPTFGEVSPRELILEARVLLPSFVKITLKQLITLICIMH